MSTVIRITLVLLLLTPLAVQAKAEPKDPCSKRNNKHCLDRASSSVTGYDSLRVAARRSADPGSDREGRPQGMSARVQRYVAQMLGVTEAHGIGSWFSYARSSFDGDHASAPYTADLDSVLIGADRLLATGGALGLAASIERRRTDTPFNGGGEDSDGYGLNLFGVHPLGDAFSVDWVAGYSSVSTDQVRIDPGSVPEDLTARFGADRWFMTGFLSGLQAMGRAWLLTGRGGLIYALEDAEGYTETGGAGARSVGSRRLHLLQAALSAELTYRFGSFEPYGFVGYRYDIDRDAGDSADAGGTPSVIPTPSDDRDEGETGLGLRWYLRSVSLSAEWLHTFARTEFASDALSLLVRSEF